ncbi:LINE-1 retrotransposable element ORF2 protein [Scomber scombrus]|uniref:LINE-1 retrotransposable element ORF2 protein n=1 Tax=Scomber scombrus TaxID=13677 RepID=A0AAV1QMN7_SCOSC
MLEIANLALLQNKLPEVWSLSNIIPVPKSGDLSKPDNYRGISLTCIMAKIYNRMILNRIRSAIDPHLRESQNGFREGRSTTAQILALRRMIEEVMWMYSRRMQERKVPLNWPDVWRIGMTGSNDGGLV